MIEWHERPEEIDRSRIAEFTLTANGVDMLATPPEFVYGSDIEILGDMQLDEARRTKGDDPTLILAYRPVIDGNADWTAIDEFPNPMEWRCSTNQSTDNGRVLTRCTKSIRIDLEPGKYALRHYLIISNDLTEEMPSVDLIGEGEFTVLSAQ